MINKYIKFLKSKTKITTACKDSNYEIKNVIFANSVLQYAGPNF